MKSARCFSGIVSETNCARTDPPTVAVHTNFFCSDVVRVISVRQFVHLMTYFFAATQFNHVLVRSWIPKKLLFSCFCSWPDSQCDIGGIVVYLFWCSSQESKRGHELTHLLCYQISPIDHRFILVSVWNLTRGASPQDYWTNLPTGCCSTVEHNSSIPRFHSWSCRNEIFDSGRGDMYDFQTRHLQSWISQLLEYKKLEVFFERCLHSTACESFSDRKININQKYSTALSCYVGSMRSFPKCPWRARKWRVLPTSSEQYWIFLLNLLLLSNKLSNDHQTVILVRNDFEDRLCSVELNCSIFFSL